MHKVITNQQNAAALVMLIASLGLAGRTWAADRIVPSPEYPNIQAAVDASSEGDTVRISAGVYKEQVMLLNKLALTLVGEPGTVVQAYSSPRMTKTLPAYNAVCYPLMGLRGSQAVISGITFDGQRRNIDYGTVNDHGLVGVYFLASSGVVTNCTFTGFRDGGTTGPVTRAVGVYCLNPSSEGSPPARIEVFDSVFRDNVYAVNLRGDPVYDPQALRATVTIKGNTITGLEPVPFDNVGVWLVDGIAGEFIDNTISDATAGIVAYDAAAQSHGQFIPLQPLLYQGNTFSNNTLHLQNIVGNDTSVVNNKFLGDSPAGSAPPGVVLSGTNLLVANNNFTDRPIGMRLISNESWAAPWPSPFPRAADVKLAENWFCNVTTAIDISNPGLIRSLDQQGTRTCPFTNAYQSIARTATGEIRVTLRGWHDALLVIESSTNLVRWDPVHTNTMAQPFTEYRGTNSDGAPQRFYRAVRK